MHLTGWFHRVSHRVRWLWATHSVHHTPTQLNLSAAYRLGWTGFFSGVWLFWCPLIFIGFHPFTFLELVALNLSYQFWLHTEMVPSLGKLEYLINTPSLHRVHHSSNVEYLDRNYGGILMIYDVLFGTYHKESLKIPMRYGLAGVADTLNPFRLAFPEWGFMARDLILAHGFTQRARAAFGPPPRIDRN